MTRIYYVEHDDLDDCVVEVTERNAEGEFFVKITGECLDVGGLDDGDAKSNILLEAWFAPEEKTPVIEKAESR